MIPLTNKKQKLLVINLERPLPYSTIKKLMVMSMITMMMMGCRKQGKESGSHLW
jgi:hypothetical protein